MAHFCLLRGAVGNIDRVHIVKFPPFPYIQACLADLKASPKKVLEDLFSGENNSE
jgi:hypothetical protein